MVRLTRVEQQERTHERLLAAGRSVFLRRGFLAATMEEIAAEAGYTRGAVYKHFGSKEALWQAILETRAAQHQDLLRAALDRVTSHRQLIAALDPSAVVSDGEARQWTVAAVEFLAAVAGRPGPAAAFTALQRRLDAELADLLARHCDRLGVTPAVSVPHLVLILGALGGGLALRHAADPDIEVAAVAATALAVLIPTPER